ncbi:MAG: V-type ATP synthase subunit K [Bacillota bacterium]|jgi:V/A-type H+-transporting ATPase subunit K
MELQWGSILAYLGMFLSISLAGYGSARGVGLAGQVACGVVAEDPTKFGKTMLLTALPGTQGIYGFVIGMLILGRIGGSPISLEIGLRLLISGLPIGIVGLLSAIWQGRVSAAGIGIVAKRPEEGTKGMIFAGLVETYAILAFIFSYLMVNAI